MWQMWRPGEPRARSTHGCNGHDLASQSLDCADSHLPNRGHVRRCRRDGLGSTARSGYRCAVYRSGDHARAASGRRRRDSGSPRGPVPILRRAAGRSDRRREFSCDARRRGSHRRFQDLHGRSVGVARRPRRDRTRGGGIAHDRGACLLGAWYLRDADQRDRRTTGTLGLAELAGLA